MSRVRFALLRSRGSRGGRAAAEVIGSRRRSERLIRFLSKTLANVLQHDGAVRR